MLSQTYFLSAGDVNAEAEMSLPLLTSKIIDIATVHANSLGIGNPAMEHLGCGWVLSRLTIEMIRYPRVNEDFILHTWVEGWNRHFSTRDFRIDDAEGNVLGYARSIWMVMNTTTHENQGLGHLSLDPSEINAEEPCPIARQMKHIHLDNGDIERKYKFQYCDLDFYRHVNTVRYVSILLNGYTLEEMDANMVDRLELSFMHEGHYGSEVEIRMRENKEADATRSYTIYDSERGHDILFARIRLKSR